MKIVALIPIKNEAWILRLSLSQLSEFVDEIIALNDSCSDDSLNICANFSNCKIINFEQEEVSLNMSLRRNILLEEGRKVGGTHFIMLDADECFSFEFCTNIRKEISKLSPGQSLKMPWVFVFRDINNKPVYESSKYIYKDFVYFDNGVDTYPDVKISEPRTPSKNNFLILNDQEYKVFHFQYFLEKRNQIKQIRYRCNELLEGKRSAYRINATYFFTKHFAPKLPEKVTDQFIIKNINLISDDGGKFLLRSVLELFEKYNAKFFEKLDIWYIPETRDYFLAKEGREPIPKIPNTVLLKINNFKNYIRNIKSHLNK